MTAATPGQAALQPGEIVYLYHWRFASGEEFGLYRHAEDAEAMAAEHAGEGLSEVLSMAVLGRPQVDAAQEPHAAPELGLPYSRCTWWSDPSDDFYGQCVTYAGHGGEHENEHGIRWTGDRWESVAARHSAEAGLPAEAAAIVAQAAPELAAAMRETKAVLGLLDDFTHAVIDLDDGARLVNIGRLAAAARGTRTKAGLPPVEGK